MRAKTAVSILVLAALVLCGCGEENVNDTKSLDRVAVAPIDREQLFAEVARAGGRLELDEEAAEKPAVSLVFEESAVEYAELGCLKELGTLRELSLRGFLVTDSGSAHVGKLTRLQELELNFTGVTDAGLAHLTDLKGLRRLSLDGSFLITDTVIRGPVAGVTARSGTPSDITEEVARGSRPSSAKPRPARNC